MWKRAFCVQLRTAKRGDEIMWVLENRAPDSQEHDPFGVWHARIQLME